MMNGVDKYSTDNIADKMCIRDRFLAIYCYMDMMCQEKAICFE